MNFEWHQASESGPLRARRVGGQAGERQTGSKRAGGGHLTEVWLIWYKNTDATCNFCILEKQGTL